MNPKGHVPQKKSRYSRYYRGFIIIHLHLGVVVVVYMLSLWVRYSLVTGSVPNSVPSEVVLRTLPLLVATRMVSMGVFHMYRELWRFVDARQLWTILKATTLGSVVFVALVWLLFGLEGYARGVFLLDWAGNILAFAGVRALRPTISRTIRSWRSGGQQRRQRLLIIGAGSAGSLLCREALDRPEHGLVPVGFIDDDPWKLGTSVLGVPVLGSREDIPKVAKERRIDTIIIAIPSANKEQRRGIAEHCRKAEVPFTILPAVPNILDGRIGLEMVRKLDIEDLLGREAVQLDHKTIDAFIRGKRVLVTGAAGSIGSELVRQAAAFQPEHLVLVDWAENPLLFLNEECKRTLSEHCFSAEVRDVSDYGSMREVMRTYMPDVVFHAAAYKHVVFMERSPVEAIRNNILGFYNVATACQDFGVKKVIFISTDKAVNPTSVMGATKRVAEMLAESMNAQGGTRFVVVRFGNVIGSSGSVIPIFQDQISRGGPVTVTDPQVERYFMTIPEAAQLVLQSGAMGSGGETFVLDMGKPVQILALAREMIFLSGRSPDRDIPIVFTGLRLGEKIAEELAVDEDKLLPTSCPKVRVLVEDPPNWHMEAEMEAILSKLPHMSGEEARTELKRLVPEYASPYQPGGPR